MTFSIDFNDKARQRTKEVGEVRAYGHLAPELVAPNLSTAEARPYKPFDLGHVASQFSSALGLGRMHQRRIGLRPAIENSAC
jgi:hypothetical protein